MCEREGIKVEITNQAKYMEEMVGNSCWDRDIRSYFTQAL